MAGAGIDDCWQLCGAYGPNNYTYHDGVTGAPVVDTSVFPSLKNLTAYAHSVGLTVSMPLTELLLNRGHHLHAIDLETDL